MNLIEIAEIYVDLINLDESTPQEYSHIKDEIGVLRSKYHNLFMDKLRENNISFSDRFEATRMAMEVVKQNHQVPA
jgi:hypothetical protein